MLSINTNISSQIVQQSMENATKLLNLSIEQMTTGYKINHAKDNAANYSISTNLTTKISAYQVAEDNTMQGLDLLTTASDSLSQIEDKLTRLRALQTQATNGTYGASSLNAINTEANAIVDEIERLYKTTSYNGINLFTGVENLNNAVTLSGTQVGDIGFIKPITKTDTSAMTKMSEVTESMSISNGQYAISTAEDLAKLASMTNSGKITGGTFYLSNDIDLKQWCAAHADEGGWTPIGNFSNPFEGRLKGNGYVISNLYINRPNEDYQGLIGNALRAETENIGLEYVDITARNYTGAVSGGGEYYSTNCYSTGIVRGNDYVGGLFGKSSDSSSQTGSSSADVYGQDYVGGIVGSGSAEGFTTGDVYGRDYVGGIMGESGTSMVESDISSTGDVTGRNYVGGLIGKALVYGGIEKASSSGTVKGEDYVGGIAGFSEGFVNCATMSRVVGKTNVGVLAGASSIAYVGGNTTYYSAINPGLSIIGNKDDSMFSSVTDLGKPAFMVNVGLQVGVNSEDSSRIGVDTWFRMKKLDDLRNIGLNTSKDYLSTIDSMLSTVSAKQTEYGAAQNRLMSALEEISVQYDNLVSSRSTLRDADIAEVSSTYIQQQILQQASATLLATANQSPSIALGLI